MVELFHEQAQLSRLDHVAEAEDVEHRDPAMTNHYAAAVCSTSRHGPTVYTKRAA